MAENKKFDKNPALLERAAKGDKEAVEELIRYNTGLVTSIAARFIGRGTDMEDLIQIGHIGLLKAIRTFDPARECAFSTYAVPLIFGEIRRFLRDDGPMKVPRTQKRLGAALIAEREKASAKGEELHIEELARRVGSSAAEAAAAMEATMPLCSLSDYLWGGEEGPMLENAVCDVEEEERNFNRLAITCALDKLPSLRRRIIKLRYFQDLSQQQTADRLGLTQVKVSREEKKILAFLQKELS